MDKNNYMKNRVNAPGSESVVAPEDGEFAEIHLPDTAPTGKTHRLFSAASFEIFRR
jgi:hypothetical protein